MEQFDSKYFRGQGKLFLGARDAAGNPVGLTFIGDLTSAEITPQVERDEVIENVTGSGGVGASWIRRSAFQIAIVMRSIRKDHLAAALQGQLVDKASSDVTDEEHTAILGAFSRLEHTNVSNVEITDEEGNVTYVAGEDYVLYPAEGMIEWLADGDISDEEAVLVTYDYAAQYHVPSSPNNEPKYLVFAGKNTADGDRSVRCEAYRVKLDPAAVSMITESSADIPLNGVVELDALRPAGDQFFSWKVEA